MLFFACNCAICAQPSRDLTAATLILTRVACTGLCELIPENWACFQENEAALVWDFALQAIAGSKTLITGCPMFLSASLP